MANLSNGVLAETLKTIQKILISSFEEILGNLKVDFD
jgi:hypothetical protein